MSSKMETTSRVFVVEVKEEEKKKIEISRESIGRRAETASKAGRGGQEFKHDWRVDCRVYKHRRKNERLCVVRMSPDPGRYFWCANKSFLMESTEEMADIVMKRTKSYAPRMRYSILGVAIDMGSYVVRIGTASVNASTMRGTIVEIELKSGTRADEARYAKILRDDLGIWEFAKEMVPSSSSEKRDEREEKNERVAPPTTRRDVAWRHVLALGALG